MSTINLEQLASDNHVAFGTSGLRALATDLNRDVCYAYSMAFLQMLQKRGTAFSQVAIAGDRRPSTPAIKQAVAEAVRDQGLTVLDQGTIPTPALAYFAQRRTIPAIMITGSHIPFDRNGIKFYTPNGEILKRDEAAIRAESVTISPSPATVELSTDTTAYDEYVQRYVAFFDGDAPLSGQRIGIYGHSSVAREAIEAVLTQLGAEIVRIGYTEEFVPIDTEAVSEADQAQCRQWSEEMRLDAVVSTDGDGDRPLVSDEKGNWLRGDSAALLCAHYLGIEQIVTPVSSNTGVEHSGHFTKVVRTRIGSPFVIEAMAQLDHGYRIAGYEANGGFLLGSDVKKEGKILEKLPTRDALVVIVALMMAARSKPLSQRVAELPRRYTYSDRLKAFPTEISQANIASLQNDHNALARFFEPLTLPDIEAVDNTDGLRIHFRDGNIIHIRPSGNAPELRCYTESDTPMEAERLARNTFTLLEQWRQ